jgi:hypothetical protein
MHEELSYFVVKTIPIMDLLTRLFLNMHIHEMLALVTAYFQAIVYFVGNSMRLEHV